jgi:hypothetical protein
MGWRGGDGIEGKGAIAGDAAGDAAIFAESAGDMSPVCVCVCVCVMD